MKGLFTILLILFLTVAMATAQTACTHFQFGFGTVIEAYTKAIAVDSLGNSYITGKFVHTTNFGNVTVNSNGWDAFVAKVSSTGHCLWVATGGGVTGTWDSGEDIVVDKQGNVYVTGITQDTSHFGTIELAGLGFLGFTAKLNPDGQWQWVTNTGGVAIAIDNQNNISVANLDKRTVSRLNSSGAETANASVTFSMPSSSEITDIDVDNFGNVLVVGNFKGNMTVGGFSLVGANSTQYDFFVAKLNGNNTWQWATKVGNTFYDGAFGVKTDAAGSGYVTGEINNYSSFGSITTTAQGDAFVAKIDPAGTWQWVAHSRVQSGYARGYDINVGYDGSIAAIGMSIGRMVFGNDTLDGSSKFFVSKLTSSGQWVLTKGSEISTSFEFGIGVGFDKLGNIYAGGYYQGTVAFGPDTLVATDANRRGLFLAKLLLDTLSLSAIPDVTVNCGDSVQLVSGASDYVSIAWQPIAGLSDSLASSPYVKPTQPITYSVIITDFCGNTLSDTVDVGINPISAIDFDYDTSGGLTVHFSAIGSSFDSILWDFGDGNVSMDFNPNHTYAQSGSYSVTITTTDVCGQTASMVKSINVSEATSIENVEGEALGWRVYPNPVQNEFLVVGRGKMIKLAVYDVMGKSIQPLLITPEGNGYKVSLPAMVPGTYILHVVVEDGHNTSKFVVY